MNIERYQTYKDSEVKWLGDIPEHWETCVVKRVAKVGHKNFVDGDWIESPYITDKGIRLIQTGNVGIGIYKEKGGRYISEKTFKDLNCTEIFPDDVLICRLDGPVGRACLVPDLQARMITSVDNTILKPSKDFDSKFIVYVMSSSLWLEWTQALCRVGGGFRFRISRSMLGELRIQKPPLSEQEAIAHYLDTKTGQIDRKVDLLTQKAALYGDLKQSLINEAVTRGLNKSVPMKDSGIEWVGEVPKHWELRRLKDIFTIKDGTHDTPKYVNISTNSYPLVTSKDLSNGRINFLQCNHISAKDYQHINKRSNVEAGDIIMPMIGSIGSPVLVETNNKFSIKNLALFKTAKLDCKRFYLYVLLSYLTDSQLNFYTSGGVQSFVSLTTLKKILSIVPPISEQKVIADYLDTTTAQIDQIIQTINTQSEKLKELRKTLINDVVTGKIKVV